MASFVLNAGRYAVAHDDVALSSDTLKLILLDDTYTPNADHNFSDMSAKELSGTGYTGGWGGSGRKTITGLTITRDDTNDRVKIDFDDVTWTSINAGNVGAAALIKEGASDDTTTIPLVVWDCTDFTTNSSGVVFQVNASGAFYL